MTINIPPQRPEEIKKFESDFGSSIAQYIYKKYIDNMYFAKDNMPIGTIKLFYAQMRTTEGLFIDPPNPDIWFFCDGRLITNPESPLYNLNTPDLTGRFPKMAPQGEIGGQETVNLQHNHSGYTQYASDSGQYSADPGGGTVGGSYHRHSISNDLSPNENVIPPFVSLQPYVRVV